MANDDRKNVVAVGNISALNRIREAVTEFALEFFREFMIRHEAKYPNLFYSPFVIYSSMAPLLVGATGKTKKELAALLKIESFESDPEILKELSILQDIILTANRHYIFYGNYFYLDHSVQCTQPFVNVLRKQFGLKPQTVNFVNNNPDEIARIINKDIIAATENAVDEVISADLIHSGTMFLIANAALFRGHWNRMFDRVDKTGYHFTAVDNYGSKTMVPVTMMTTTQHFKHYYCKEAECQVLRMTYESSELVMIYILPDKILTSLQLIKKFNRKILIDMLALMKTVLIRVSIPKFALDPNDIRIRGTMRKMGATTLFRKNEAQLQGISTTSGLYLERIAHKSLIIIDERGSVHPNENVANKEELKNNAILPKFEANHPFMFLVIEEKANVIVFMGFLGDPRQTLEVYTEQDLSEEEVNQLLRNPQQ